MKNATTGRLAALLFPLLAFTVMGTAQAESKNIDFDSVEEKNLQNGKFVFDEAKGYIFLHGNSRQWGVFIKEPSAENIAAYEAEWTEEFEKAKSKYVRQIENWDEKSQG